jgi:hypothetical protein
MTRRRSISIITRQPSFQRPRNSQSDAADPNRRQGRHGRLSENTGCDAFDRKGEGRDFLAVQPRGEADGKWSW